MHIFHSRNDIIVRKGYLGLLTTVIYYELFMAIITIYTPEFAIRKEDIHNINIRNRVSELIGHDWGLVEVKTCHHTSNHWCVPTSWLYECIP